ncbi:AAA family ATPase [Paeniglutamicibacter gangotriensis]|uniref:AAA family ATPase n=1 Tax=Paeniglutamicibacter gangotriensis TaxID=254787 RepID=A0A5B0E365_9MICC|nr:UvrD-helicase domain-containing protein [Paeniglutamicibacter gangotriensis]KAA0973283.1 AAA family ATPase [Paeniglutamicibacter gangotriensis]
MPESTTVQPELEAERNYVTTLYARLDELRAEKVEQLTRTRRTGPQGSIQNVSERDSFAALYEDRLAQLNAVEDKLVFGRLDLDDDVNRDGEEAGAPRYIGRIGMTDDELRRLMVDWRAPEAAAFYQATALHRQGVRRRRHLMLRGRMVLGIDDEVLDTDLFSENETEHLQGEGALMAALTQKRTGRMGDIVGTIQSEQDAIIRSPLAGVLVVQGGPGTGKTAVALHRAAFLLYEHRERLNSAGVLLVGPSNSFMRYIERVLPSLGETGVVMASVGELYPGIIAVPEQNRESARIKGKAFMAKVMAKAVSNRQRLLAEDRRVVVEGTRLVLTRGAVRHAREKARASRKPHNEAREVFTKTLVRELAEQLQQVLEDSAGNGNAVDRSYLVQEVRESRDVRIALNLCWMPMTPQSLLEELYAKEHLLAAAAPQLNSRELAALHRSPGSPWTESDVPLLDEAAELLGDFKAVGNKDGGAEAQLKRDVENAEATLQNVEEMLFNAGIDGLVEAEDLAAMNQETAARQTAAERAVADRNWAYGHVVVDEAQELSPMQWRLLMRRCPLKSFTVVGDIAQTSSASGASSWAQAMKPFVAERFTLEELTVNYRTPMQIAEAATRVAHAAGLTISTPKAVREGQWPPLVDRLAPGELLSKLHEVLPGEVAIADGGLLAVIVPESRLTQVRAAVQGQFGRRVGSGSGGLSQDIVVLGAREAKGLEFDVVVVIEPQEMIDEVEGSVGDLYVAMTRTTQRLRIMAEGEIPAGIDTEE